MKMHETLHCVMLHKVKTAHSKEVLCFIFCGVYLLFTFVTFAFSPFLLCVALSLLSSRILHAKDKYFEPSAIEYGWFEFAHKNPTLCHVRSSVCVCVAHIENDEHSCFWRWYKYRSTNMHAILKVDVRHWNNNNFRIEIKPFESNATERVWVFSTGILNIHVYVFTLSWSLSQRRVSASVAASDVI